MIKSPTGLKVFIQRENLLVAAGHDAGLLVVAHALFEEVGLALQGDHIHPGEGVFHVVNFGLAQSGQQTVGDKLDVLAH